MVRAMGKVAAICASLGLGASVAAQTMASRTWATGMPCDQVAVQAVIDNVPQQVIGIACRQPDGSWQFMDSVGGVVDFYPQSAYYAEPWNAALAGVGLGTVFVDRFPCVHPMHGVFVRCGGMSGFRGDGRGRGFRAVPPGGFRAGPYRDSHGAGMHHP